MSSNAHRIETLQAGHLDSRLYDNDPQAGPLRLSRGALLAPLSRAFDLAERRSSGHAHRVAYVAMYLASELDLPPGQIEAAFFAGLLHDVGVATAGLSPNRQAISESAQWAEIVKTLNLHCDLGARLVRRLGLGEDVARAILHHHDSWDGSGLPGGLSGERLPLLARVIGAADRVESLFDQDESPLAMRRTGPAAIAGMGGVELDPEMTSVMVELSREDGFWLGFHGDELESTLVALNYGGMLCGEELQEFLGAIADLVDARNGRSPGHARRVARTAGDLAHSNGMSEARTELVRSAALLQDIGTLGVPIGLLHKPDILSVDEMATIQMHPTYARDILGEIPGFGPAAWWIACHHERVDGKGYPAMLEGAEVPIEAQIIGICETFEALVNDRPHRKAMGHADALDILHGLAGERFDAQVVASFEAEMETVLQT